MTLFHRFLPTFEKPVARPRHIHIEEESREFSGIAVVLLIAASCGVALALWEPSQQVTSPFVTASAPPPAAPAIAPTATAKIPEPETTANAAETTAASADETAASADIDDDQTPTVKLSAQCAQRATARRDCANAKAFKETRLNAPEPTRPEPAASEPVGSIASQPAVKEAAPAKNAPPTKTPATAKETTAAAKATTTPPKETPPPVREAPRAVPAEVVAAVAAVPVETLAAQQQRTAATPKAKQQRQRAADRDDDGPVERLTRVGERTMPDGRRVTVYRRSNGTYEVGSVVDGEYRPTRRMEAGARYFGLQ
jgi:hypothetical protein